MPAFFLLLYGYALNFDIRNVTLAVQDQDRSTKSRELVSAFVNSGYFALVGYVDSPIGARSPDRSKAACARSCRSRRASSATCRCGSRSTVQVIIDGDNANTASTVMGYARTLIGEYSAAQMQSLMSAPGVPAPGSRRSPSSRASGTTRSCAARCSSCPG